MSFKLIQDLSKGAAITGHLYQKNDECLYWGKAFQVDKTTFMGMQGAVSCKDHLVDVLYRNTASISVDSWTKTQREENCFFIYAKNNTQLKRIQRRIKTILNPYEEKHGFSTTIFYPIEEHPIHFCTNNTIAVIKGDQQWTKNSCLWSLYLCLFRLCAEYISPFLDFKTPFTSQKENKKGTRDTGYYDKFSPIGKTTFLSVIDNPKKIMLTDERYDEMTLYLKGEIPAHGKTGLFYLLDNYKTTEEIKKGFFHTYDQSFFKLTHIHLRKNSLVVKHLYPEEPV